MVTINPGIPQHSYTSTVWLLYLLHGSLGKEKLHNVLHKSRHHYKVVYLKENNAFQRVSA